MPKSFGNKTFVAPPSRVVAAEDAGDLADLQEAMKHMTIMNRYSPGLKQATRRVVLSSGAMVVVRRAFGHESITLFRREVSDVAITPCKPYVESGRQRFGDINPLFSTAYLPGNIDISANWTGGCNGPCPGDPISSGESGALNCLKPTASPPV